MATATARVFLVKLPAAVRAADHERAGRSTTCDTDGIGGRWAAGAPLPTTVGTVLGVLLTLLTEKYRQRPTLVLRGNYGAGGFSLLRIGLRHEL